MRNIWQLKVERTARGARHAASGSGLIVRSSGFKALSVQSSEFRV